MQAHEHQITLQEDQNDVVQSQKRDNGIATFDDKTSQQMTCTMEFQIPKIKSKLASCNCLLA